VTDTVEITEGLDEDMEVVTGSFRAINRDLEDGALIKVDNQERRGIAQSN